MGSVSEALAIALQHHQAGRLPAAEQIYRQILAAKPDCAEALHLLGILAHQAGQPAAAIESMEAAIRLNPAAAIYHHNLGEAYRALAKTSEAIACYEQALRLNPQFVEAHHNLGNALRARGQLAEAIACYEWALELKPDFAEARHSLSCAKYDQGEVAEAIDGFRRVIEQRPDDAEGQNNLGAALMRLGRVAEAAGCYRRALQLNPGYAEAHYNLGNALKDLGQFAEAIACCQRALQLKPDMAEAHYSLANLLKDQGRLPEAVACCRRALQLKPDYAAARGELVHQLQHLCLWDDLSDLSRQAIEGVEAEAAGLAEPLSPFTFLALSTPTTAAQQQRCASRWTGQQLHWAIRGDLRPGPARREKDRTRIAVGYLSADFHEHATACLMAELFEKHDRGRIAVFGYSYGPDDGSPMRRRLVNAFDRFADLKDAPFAEAAERIALDGVEILVDLKGYTGHARTQILALRPAPIQVNYLGYPGTMGAPFLDYILVDDFIVPPDQQPFFTEKLVHLPGCYQVNDSQRDVSPRTPTRARCGLPDDVFVFCSFNSSYKITPEMFDVWMALLAAIPGSVLWLLEGNPFAPANLRQAAAARGIAADRLVFAPHRPLPDHLARHRVADLFLDTFPVNAHTTASDALWAGCPVLTLTGETFVSRVAGSLLRAVGLPELITSSLTEYAALAAQLARDADRLAGLRARLAANRATSPLFDAGRFARGIEQAYATMWQIHASGQPPRGFAVEATSAE